MEKIRVMFITSLFEKIGGAERNIYDIVCNLDRKRFIPYVVCLQGGELVEEVREKGIYADKMDIAKIASLEAVKKGIRLFHFLRRERIQVVVTYHHDADIWGGSIAVLARVPVVISSRRDLGYKLEKKHIWAYRFLNKIYTKILSVSEAVKNEIIKREWVKPIKFVTLYNGVNDALFKTETNQEKKDTLRNSLGIKETDFIIGNFGAFRPIKGQIYLVRALPEIVKRNKSLKVLFVGLNTSDYYKEVQRTVKALGLEDHVIFTGHRKDIPDLIAIIDVLVNSSISEGFSNAILETMASGKPVIASNSGGNSEAIVHGETGFLFPPCESASLATFIIKLIENEDLRRSMGKEGANRVKKYFTMKTMIERTEDLYESLVKASHSTLRNNRFGYYQNIKKLVKISLSYALYYSGVVSVYKRILNKAPHILAYHSINSITVKSLEIEQDPLCFEKQILYLKNNFQVLSLSEFLHFRNKGANFPPNAVLLTFDDGYRDNYLYAYPVLKNLGLPAVIFLTTDPIETQCALFFDAVRFAFSETRRLILDLRDIGLSRFLLEKGNGFHITRAIKEIVEYSKRQNNTQNKELLDLIYFRLGLNLEDTKKRQTYLSWSEVKEMAESGIEFGSHTKSHPQLSSLSQEVCKEELIQSKMIIEEHTGKKIRALAYPFGGNKDYNDAVEKVAYEMGYECAFSLINNRLINSYTVGRKMVDTHMSASFSGKFCKPLFAADLIGIYER